MIQWMRVFTPSRILWWSVALYISVSQKKKKKGTISKKNLGRIMIRAAAASQKEERTVNTNSGKSLLKQWWSSPKYQQNSTQSFHSSNIWVLCITNSVLALITYQSISQSPFQSQVVLSAHCPCSDLIAFCWSAVLYLHRSSRGSAPSPRFTR